MQLSQFTYSVLGGACLALSLVACSSNSDDEAGDAVVIQAPSVEKNADVTEPKQHHQVI